MPGRNSCSTTSVSGIRRSSTSGDCRSKSVRIDRALLDGNNGSDATASGMLRAVTAMTHELGRKVIVQGVETDEDVGYLRSIECEYGQGFYYGDPISERDVLQLLKLVRKSERRIQPRGLFRAAVRKKAPDEAPQTADAIADAAVGAPQEREAVPAMAAALAGATGCTAAADAASSPHSRSGNRTATAAGVGEGPCAPAGADACRRVSASAKSWVRAPICFRNRTSAAASLRCAAAFRGAIRATDGCTVSGAGTPAAADASDDRAARAGHLSVAAVP